MSENWEIIGTTFEDEEIQVSAGFQGTYKEAQKFVDSLLDFLEKEYGFFHKFEYIKK